MGDRAGDGRPTSGQGTGPIFVVGAMGSGTTLLRLILDSHENIAIARETTFARSLLAQKQVPFWQFGAEWYERLGWSVEEFDEELRTFYDRLFSRLARQHGKRRWGDKSPQHVWHMHLLAEVWPDAQILGIVRHPAAAANSVQRRFGYPWDRAVRHWRRYTFAMVRSGMALGDRFALCRYEDLLAAPEPTTRALLDWLGEPWSPSVLEHHLVQADRSGPSVVEGRTRTTDALDPARMSAWVDHVDAPRRSGLRRKPVSALAHWLGYDLDRPSPAGPLLPGGGDGPVVTGTDLARRRNHDPGRVKWSETLDPSMANSPLTPERLEARLHAVRREPSRGPDAATRPVVLRNGLRKIRTWSGR